MRVQSGLAVRGRGLDEQHVAAASGHGEASGHTRRRRALGGLREELRTTEGRFDARLVDVHRHERGVGCDLGRDLPQHLRELALEVPHSRLTRVVHDDVADRGVVDLDVLVTQAVAIELRGQQVVAGDDDLLVLGVAVETHDLHAVEQRAGDRVGDVRRRDEHDVGEVELDLEVVITERVVLRGIEHLEQRRRRITRPATGAQLVDLVEEHDRVHRARLGDGADEPARLCAHVGAPMPADLGLVAHAAERDADERAPHRSRDGLAE